MAIHGNAEVLCNTANQGHPAKSGRVSLVHVNEGQPALTPSFTWRGKPPTPTRRASSSHTPRHKHSNVGAPTEQAAVLKRSTFECKRRQSAVWIVTYSRIEGLACKHSERCAQGPTQERGHPVG